MFYPAKIFPCTVYGFPLLTCVLLFFNREGSKDTITIVFVPYCTVGTFGQHQLWNIRDHNTYMHPFIPGEILTDPSSLPKTMESTHQGQPSGVKPEPVTSIRMNYSNHRNRKEVSVYLRSLS